MNLIITDQCNRSCVYCFARDKIELNSNITTGKLQKKQISLEAVDCYLDFLENSNIKLLKVLGGEPTLHPHFSEIIDRSIARKFDVAIFTNGLWPNSVLDYFKMNNQDQVSFVINVNEPNDQNAHETKRQKKCLETAGKRAMIGFNIYREHFDLLFCENLIDTFGLKREIRLGLASPIIRGKNAYLKNTSLKRIGKRLCGQLRRLERNDILGALDCGFPLCMFEENDLGSLSITTTGFHSHCESIIDVDANLNAWPCFPLSKVLNVNLPDFDTASDLIEFYSKKLAPLRSIGSMDECIVCKFLKRGQCCGGCLGRTIQNIEDSGDLNLVDKIQARKA